MSRGSFNIRKLLIKTWPENDDDEEGFECSSARTIRMQYELEQYQTQHIQKARHEHKHLSWISNAAVPKTTGHSKVPTPIAVGGQAGAGVLNSGSAGRRASTPLPVSPMTGRGSPATPLSLRSSEESLASVRKGSLSKPQQSQHLVMPRRSSKVATSANTRSHEDAQTPAVIMTTANAATNRSNRSSYVMDGRVQQVSPFVNGQPSPPLEPDEFLQGVIDHQEVLREMPSVSTISLNGESTWLNEDSGDLSDVSDNVQQLIWETDEAFKAVSSALAEARLASQPPAPSVEDSKPHLQHLRQASQTLQEQHEPVAVARHSPTPQTPIDTVSPMPPTPGAGRGIPSEPLTVTPHILKSAVVENSVAKPKGSRSPKAQAMHSMSHESSASNPPQEALTRGTGGQRSHHSYHRSISRLNLAADKVTDKLFEGRTGRFGFLKIEADEVVTPDQLEQFRRDKLAKQLAEATTGRQAFNETPGSVANIVGDESSSDADLEPFHLQDVPSRVGHSGVDVLSPVIEVPTPEPFELNKGLRGQIPSLAGARTPTRATKQVEVGQDSLATPPPSPPQHPIDMASAQTVASRAANAEDDESTHPKNLGYSKLANRRLGHKRSASSTSHIASLPTIPEVNITAPQAWDASRLTQQQGRKALDQHGRRSRPPATDANGNPYFEEDEEHMFFMSNPVTATIPTFQHGRICLAKADLVNAGTINSLESKLLTSPDETLDWTAFQMAILGGAGDLFSDPDNFLSRDAQEEMVDDLCDWFEDLGFSNGDLGALVHTDESRNATASRALHTPQTAVMSTPGSGKRSFHDPSHNRKQSVASSSSSLGSGLTHSGDSPDHSIPIAVESEHPSGFWNSAPQHSADTSASDRFHGGPGLKRWTLEGHPKRYQGVGIDVAKANVVLPLGGAGKALPRTPESASTRRRAGRASIDSLPQSPMLELRMMTGVDGNREFVSMGYNLNHDLGDFLKWESEHAYASGFYGSE